MTNIFQVLKIKTLGRFQISKIILIYSINEFKVRQTIEKEYERLIKEEKNYPPGTIKLFELERVNILNKLIDSRNALLEELAKYPVSSHVRSIKIQNSKASCEHKLEEVENAIKTFERNKVFLKK